MRRDELLLPEPPENDRPDDRWVCGRTGAPCLRGPCTRGACRSDARCKPQRTWRGRRRLAIGLSLLSLVILGVVSLVQPLRRIVFKPGELMSAHAQILSGTLSSQRCSACHPNSSISTVSWVGSALEHHGATQADRCLDCHEGTMHREVAKLAHNLTRAKRASLRAVSTRAADTSWHDALPSPAVDSENVQCSACHVEHRGAEASMLVISDRQCQTCHRDRFGSFAQSHPSFEGWPYGRGNVIAFNHATHATRHFPATKNGEHVARFECINCHIETDQQELTRTVVYERSCAGCHDASLQLAAAEGIELLALPTIPEASAEQVRPWPQWATGFFDGRITPIAELLLRFDPLVALSIKRIPETDLSRVDPANDEMVNAAEVIARAHRELIQRIGEQGQQAILDRIAATGVRRSTMHAFVRALPPQLIAEANRRWFDVGGEYTVLSPPPRSPSRSPVAQTVFQRDSSLLSDDSLLLDDGLLRDPDTAGDLLDGDALGVDPLNTDPLAVADEPRIQEKVRGIFRRYDAGRLLPEGGWFRDDNRMSIRYRGSGHADPVLTSTVEWLSQLRDGDPARDELLKSRAIAACVTCHPGAMESAGNWVETALVGGRDQFTKFSHAPHLRVAELGDCKHCHQVSSSHADSSREFEPLHRSACASCHTRQVAGDSCILCHRYHIDLQPREIGIARPPAFDRTKRR